MPDKSSQPSSSYELRSFETLNHLINNYLVVAPKGFVDEGFNINEHNRLYDAALFVLNSADPSEGDAEFALDILRITCHGHLVSDEEGNLIMAVARQHGYISKEEQLEREISKDI